MPRLRKKSLEQRKLVVQNAVRKYRENNPELVREKNKLALALRRANEEYRLKEKQKDREYQRKKRYCEQMKEKIKTQKAVITNNEFQEKLPTKNKQSLALQTTHEEDRLKEKHKAREYQLRKRYREKIKEKIKAQKADITNNEFQVKLPTKNKGPIKKKSQTKKQMKIKSHAIEYDEFKHLSNLENYYLMKNFQNQTHEMMKYLNSNIPTCSQICISNGEVCIPLPLKKSFKFNPNAVKRGRGRPRKDSLASNISNPHNSSFLEEDLQCSTDDDEDGFQEVSEDENNPSSFLDQGERLHSGVNEDGSELIDAANIKTEMKIEPTQIGEDDSMDLDPNYDPSDFLTMHNRMGNTESNQQQQQDNKMSQFLQQDEAQNDNVQTINDNKPSMHQMPLMMGSNDNMGIDDDLAISESDEEDEGNVRVKREIFTDQMDDEQQQQQQQQQHSMMDMQMQQQQQQQQEQLPLQPYTNIDQQQQQQHHQVQNQSSHHDDNNDDDWLRF